MKGIRAALPLSALEVVVLEAVVLASRAGAPSIPGEGVFEVAVLGLAPSSTGVGALELVPAPPARAVSTLEAGVLGVVVVGLAVLGRVGAGITRLRSDPGGRIVGSGVLESTRGGALGAAGAMVMGRPGTSGTGVTRRLEGGPETVGVICLAGCWAGAAAVCCTLSGASCGGVGAVLAA